MTASESNPEKGQESTGSQTRRQFLGAAATAAALAAGDVSTTEHAEQEHRLLALADRDEGERWVYDADDVFGTVRSPLVTAELTEPQQTLTGGVETYSVDSSGIPLSFNVAAEDLDANVGGLIHLGPEQAEALAVDLLEQAHAARDTDE